MHECVCECVCAYKPSSLSTGVLMGLDCIVKYICIYKYIMSKANLWFAGLDSYAKLGRSDRF